MVEQHFLQLFPIQRPSPLSLLPPLKPQSQFITSLHQNGSPSQLSLRSSTTSRSSSSRIRAAVSQDEFPPNAVRWKRNSDWHGGFSLGVDLGMSRTGVALGKSFINRPLTVLELRGEKLELRLLEIAERQEVDEFIIGIPKSGDGKENQQSNKVRSVAGRLAVRAAERGVFIPTFVMDLWTSSPNPHHKWVGPSGHRLITVDARGSGDFLSVQAAIESVPDNNNVNIVIQINAGVYMGWRVYLQNEHGTSTEAQDFMLNMGVKKSARQGKIDAYAAMMVLERYFSMSGVGTELVLPKQLELQERLRQGPPKDLDFFPE